MNRDPDTLPVMDMSDRPPMALERPGRLQADCQRLEVFATEGEMPRLQAIYDVDSYALLDLDQRLLMNELEGRARER